MKHLFLMLVISLTSLCAIAQQPKEKAKLVFDKNKPVYELEASCGMCQFKMEGKGCELAVKYKDKYYYVTGAAIDDFGDAHDDHGFCNAIRKAKVQGELVGDKFHITWFELK